MLQDSRRFEKERIKHHTISGRQNSEELRFDFNEESLCDCSVKLECSAHETDFLVELGTSLAGELIDSFPIFSVMISVKCESTLVTLVTPPHIVSIG